MYSVNCNSNYYNCNGVCCDTGADCGGGDCWTDKWHSIPFASIDYPIQQICMNCADFNSNDNQYWNCQRFNNKPPRYVGNIYNISKRKRLMTKSLLGDFVKCMANGSTCAPELLQYILESPVFNKNDNNAEELEKIPSDPFILNANRKWYNQFPHMRYNLESNLGHWYNKSNNNKATKQFLSYLNEKMNRSNYNNTKKKNEHFPKHWFRNLHQLYCTVTSAPQSPFYQPYSSKYLKTKKQLSPRLKYRYKKFRKYGNLMKMGYFATMNNNQILSDNEKNYYNYYIQNIKNADDDINNECYIKYKRTMHATPTMQETASISRSSGSLNSSKTSSHSIHHHHHGHHHPNRHSYHGHGHGHGHSHGHQYHPSYGGHARSSLLGQSQSQYSRYSINSRVMRLGSHRSTHDSFGHHGRHSQHGYHPHHDYHHQRHSSQSHLQHGHFGYHPSHRHSSQSHLQHGHPSHSDYHHQRHSSQSHLQHGHPSHSDYHHQRHSSQSHLQHGHFGYHPSHRHSSQSHFPHGHQAHFGYHPQRHSSQSHLQHGHPSHNGYHPQRHSSQSHLLHGHPSHSGYHPQRHSSQSHLQHGHPSHSYHPSHRHSSQSHMQHGHHDSQHGHHARHSSLSHYDNAPHRSSHYLNHKYSTENNYTMPNKRNYQKTHFDPSTALVASYSDLNID